MDAMLKLRLEASLVSAESALAKMTESPTGMSRYEMAEWHFTRGHVLLASGDKAGSRSAFEAAVKANQFHMDAQLRLEGM
jgi:predicted negative regulator of RcsB-dependent stress response